MKKVFGFKRRTAAFLLAVTLVLSTFGGTPMTAYAAQTSAGAEAPEEAETAVTQESEGVTEEAVTAQPQESTVQETVPAEPTEETSAENEEETQAAEELSAPVNDGEGTEETAGAYIGTTGEEEGRSALYIRWSEYKDALAKSGSTEEEIAGVDFNDTVILDILQKRKEANADEKFNIISIDYESVKDSISADLWNAVVERLEAYEDSGTSVNYNFYGETATDENWCFNNPAEASEAVNTALTLNLPSNDTEVSDTGISVSFASTAFPADEAYVNLYTDETEARTAYYAGITEVLGTEECDLALVNSADGTEAENAGGHYNLMTNTVTETDSEGNEISKEIKSLNISIGNVMNLSADVDYSVAKAVYKGRIDTWTDENGEHNSLNIHFGEAGKETSLTAEELLAILELNAGNTFDEVNIDQCIGETNTIYKAVADKAYTLLKPAVEGEERRLQFTFTDTATDAYMTWILINPQAEQSEDQNVSGAMTINNDNTVSVNVGNQTLAAEEVRAAFGRSVERDADSVNKLREIFGGDQCDITIGDGLSDGWFNIDDYNARVEFRVGGLTAGEEYTVAKTVYKGRIDTWTDENGEHSSLNIHFGEAGKETSLTAEELLAILEMNAGNTFDEVNIDQCIGETNTIYKAVADKAYTLLKPAVEGEERRLQFSFADTATDAYTAWILINPQAEQSEDQNVSAAMTINDNTVSVNVGNQSLAAEEVRVAFRRSVERDADSVNKLREIFGGDQCDLMVEDGLSDGWFNIDDYNANVELRVGGLTAGQEYTVARKSYRGDIDEEQNSIYISALSLEKDKFGEGDLEDILQYYIDNNRKFDVVHIEEKIDAGNTSNIIKKDYINLAKELLSTEEDSEKRLTFIFCNCYETENGEYIEDDMKWSLINPGTADADIDASVELNVRENAGIVLSVEDNSYSADEVTLQFLANVKTSNAKQMTSALGEAYPQDSEDSRLLMSYGITSDKAADHVSKLKYSYDTCADWRKEDNDNKVSLYIGNIQKTAAQFEYVLLKQEKIEELITEKWQIPIPEAAEDIEYRNFNSAAATVHHGTLTPVGNGDVDFIVQYTLNDKIYRKAYRVSVGQSLASLAFEKTELTMELPEEGADWEAREYLNVRYYPSNAGVDRDPGTLTWTTSNPAVVELVAREDDGKYDGEIKAVGAGTATIRAAYDDTIYAECVVTVEKPFVVPDEEWGDICAVTNLDKTLADVALPSKNWKWKDSSTKLEPYFGMERQRFAAVYTAEDGRTREFMLEIRMVTITGVDICAVTVDENNNLNASEVPTALTNGETVVFNYGFGCENGGWDDVEKYFSSKEKEGRLKAVWSSSPSNIGTTEVGEPYPFESYQFTADSNKSGKKTFTLSLVDTENGNKVIAKQSVSLTVTKQPVMDYDRMTVRGPENQEENGNIILNGKAGDTGSLYLTAPKEGYYALTVKSTDASVLALGRTSVKEEKAEDGTEVYTTEVPYTIKKAGVVQLLVTAQDEIKSTQSIDVTIIDKEPKVLESSFNINKAYSEKIAPLTIAYTDSYGAADGNSITLTGTYANDFTYNPSYADGKASGYLTLKNTNLKNGTYEVGLKIKVQNTENPADTEEFTVPVKVKVADKKPKITFKQTKKVNTFYKAAGENHSGLLTVNVSDAELVSLTVNEGAKFKVEKTADEKVYKIALADKVTEISKADKKVTLTCTIKDAVYGTYTMQKVLSVAVENKAPKLVLSAKSDTLYTQLGYLDSTLLITDSANVPLTCSKAAWVENKSTIRDFMGESITAKLKKNTFILSYEENGLIHFALDTDKAGTDKITIRVQADDWTKPVDMAYSIKVDTKLPKLKLSNTKLTLNKNEQISGKETETKLSISGCALDFRGDVRFEGADDKSKAILNDKLALEHWGDGRIVARLNTTKLNNQDLAAGTYKYTVTAIEGEFEASAVLTVTIADAAPEKCIKVSKKGSIDVLRRESTYVSLTAKVKNMPGTVIDGWLTGQDADLFYTEFDSETGQLRVKANEGVLLSTKNTYKVKPVFQLTTTTGSMYEVTAGEQSIKVKQGKPKLTVTAPLGNVLYRQAGNSLQLKFSVALSGEEIAVENVELLNYNSDLNAEYDGDTQTVSLTQESMRKIASTGKKWKLNFAVSYRDKAGNEKKAVVNYQVVIK